MARITVLGGTGYAGSNLVAEAAKRGHEVVAYSRHTPESPVPGVEYRTADLLEDATVEAAVEGADVVVSALSPRGELAGKLRDLEARLATVAASKNVRIGVIGGAGSLAVSEGGPRVMDTPNFPDAFKDEASEMGAVLEDLRANTTGLDWFYVSPAGGFGGFAPGEARGTYRVGKDVLLVDDQGESFISGADLALAIVDEIEKPQHHNERFTVAY